MIEDLDALGKPPSGILAGNGLLWLGSYSECTKKIDGAHYCLAEVDLGLASILFENSHIDGGDVNVNSIVPSSLFGICAPSECSEQDVSMVVKKIISVVNQTWGINSSFRSVHCNKKSEYTSGAIATIALCAVILSLCLVGTIADVLLSFTRPSTRPVDKSNEYLPVTNDSMEIDDTQEANAPNILGSNKQNGCRRTRDKPETTSLISRSPPVDHFQPRRRRTLLDFFLCFSLIKNTSSIMDTEVRPGSITSIHGMRVLSMWWVVLGHCFYYLVIRTPAMTRDEIVTVPTFVNRFTAEAVVNATLSVDTFFVLSGLLVAYVSLRRMEKSNGKLPIFQFYFHRFYRLTPTYMFVLLFYAKLLGFFSEGPLWFKYQTNEECDKHWWTNLLYINNIYPGKDECMGWSWYLATDMQFYIIAPIILFTTHRFRLKGLLTIVGFLMCSSFISTAAIYSHYDVRGTPFSSLLSGEDASNLVYVKPYCRIAPYLVGLTLGYLLQHKREFKGSKMRMYLFSVTGWCVAVALAVTTLYGPEKDDRLLKRHPFTHTGDVIYGTFGRFAWSLATAWVIFACHHGLGGFVNKILSARFWIPLSRLTYCTYLVHIIAINTLSGSFKTMITYNDIHMAFIFAGVLVMAYAAAFIVSVCVEFPIMELENLIFTKRS
ncbi:nose resistant to fluoxetine protein 6-like [Acropora muricata]|uniref:nose resistant to fluoxetine protein 6-like n=1 Tax=Acropora muricata TaxID=159855 RepID=UPI0034E505CB